MADRPKPDLGNTMAGVIEVVFLLVQALERAKALPHGEFAQDLAALLRRLPADAIPLPFYRPHRILLGLLSEPQD